ncbi:replication protein, partial [Acinetobacter johnsonii]
GKPSKAHGLNLKVGSKDEILADYISKWGLAEEMTQAHQKIGKKNRQSLTPWEILDLSRMEASTKDKYGHLFSVYASAFKGRRQLFWSKGLKELLKVADKSDEQLANEHSQDEPQDEVYENMLNLGEQDWWTICFHRM